MADLPKAPTWQVSTKQRTARAVVASRFDRRRDESSGTRCARTDFDGASFRRQTPIGPYIVDFVCHAANLIIEIDGGQHFETEHEQRDARRDAFLASKGYRVLRFNNLRCDDQSARRVGDDRGSASSTPSPHPSPASGGGSRPRAMPEEARHEIHPLLAARSISTPTRRSATLADKLTMIGLEVEKLDDKGKLLGAVHDRARDLGRAASECRPAARVHGRHRRGRSGAGRVRRAQRAHRHEGRVRAAGRLHPGQGHHARQSATSAASRAAACWCRNSSCSSPTTTKASSSCRPMRRSARATRNGPGSTTR